MQEETMRNVLTLGAVLICSISASAQTNNYTVSNIATNTQDPRMQNPWGLSRPTKSSLPENEWWVNDQVTGLSTLYDVNGTIVKLAVTVPSARGFGTGSPTGTTVNPSTNDFAFVTLDGTLSIWFSTQRPSSPGPACAQCHVTTATIKVNNSAKGASYQGMTIATNATSGKLTYYVANTNGGVEAYDATTFSPVTLPAGAFTDSKIPGTYAPAGIQSFGKIIGVAYNAKAGGGTGYVDLYDTNGKLVLRVGPGANGTFNRPWGMAISPANFGKFSGDLLVGNTGSGWIGAYDLKTGGFEGFLQSNGSDVALPGLWGLEFGNGNAESGPTNVLYFNTGGVSQTTGVFGAIIAH
jgi:uncharacterized protein (TIGR03118 family)